MTDATIQQLTGEVDDLTRKVNDMANILALLQVNGLNDAFDGSGNQLFGGGKMRLDKNGIQVASSGALTGLYFLNAPVVSPSTTYPQAILTGRADAIGNYIGLVIQPTSAGSSQAYANLIGGAFFAKPRFDLNNASLWIEGGTADPAGAAGLFWFRTDLVKARFYGTVWQNLAVEALTLAVTAKSADYTAIGTDAYIPCDATTTALTVTLPAATGTGKVYTVKKIDASVNAVTIAAAGTDTIETAATVTLAARWNSRTIIDSATGSWAIMAST